MKISIGQLYTEPGVNYPFSNVFQHWLGKEIADRVQPSVEWASSYGADCSLMLRINAKSGLVRPEIKGPTVFKSDRDVEVTIFLPHNGQPLTEKFDLRQPLKFMLGGIIDALRLCRLDSRLVEASVAELIEQAAENPAMISQRKLIPPASSPPALDSPQ